MNTVLDLVNELEALQAKWNDKLIIMIEGDSYKFSLDAGSMYTELNGGINIDIIDADAQTSEFTQVIDTVQDLKTFFMDISNIARSKNPNIDIKTLSIYFLAVELNNDDPDIIVEGWKSVKKTGNQIVITVSKKLKTW